VHCLVPLKCGSQIQSGAGAVAKTNRPTTRATKTTETKATETKSTETKTTETKTTETKTTETIVTYTNADAFISSSVLLCFFIVPSIVAIGTTFLRCYDVGGKSFVYIDLEKECYQGQHLFFSLLVAWPMILFYGALLPGYAMLLLRRAGAARSTDPHLMLRWGMLHSGYRSSKFWWELVVLLRKYFIIMLVTFNSKGEYQLHMALGIVMVALHLHDSQRPFGHRHVNPTNAVLHRYEMGSLVILLGMLWCGGFFSLNLCHTESGWCDFMVVVVLVCNFLLMAVLVTLFVKGWCKRNHLDEKISRMVGSRRSAASRRSGSSVVGQKTTRGWSSHDVVGRELENLEGEVKTNPMLSPAQSAALAQDVGEGSETTRTTVEVMEEKDEHEILTDPATDRKYSWNTKTGETVWIDEEEEDGEEEEEEDEDEDTEILFDPVSGRKYVHHIPSGNTTWLDG
jgi:hypothetical protein